MDGTAPDINSLIAAITSHDWPLLVAVAVVIMVYIFRNLNKNKIPTKYLPWISLAVGVLSVGATQTIMYIQDGDPATLWWHGLIRGSITGLISGFVASGMWSAGVKFLLNGCINTEEQPKNE